MPAFEKLERLNALIDVWIDEEKYELVEKVCMVNSELKTHLDEATQTEKKCTCNDKEGNNDQQDESWLKLLNEKKNSLPIEAVKIPPGSWTYSKVLPDLIKDWSKLSSLDRYWSRLFWVKLIRSKIQQKGIDCYFRRLDQVVGYLGRNLPLVDPDKKVDQDKEKEKKLQKNTKKLTAIYLFEMATTGLEVDIRSFAERARRVLKEIRDSDEKNKNKDNSTANKAFADFYELLAGYNIGLSYLHASEYRNAVREFNLIISEFIKTKHPEKLEDKKDQEKYNNLRKLIKKRFGRELLFHPAVLYRAEIQLKLQLAYHAFETTFMHSTLRKLTEYKKVRTELIKTEAFIQMDRQDESLKALNIVVSSIKGSKSSLSKRKLKWEKIFDNIKNAPDGKMDNVKGRAIGLMMDWQLQHLEKNILKNYGIDEDIKQLQYYKNLSDLLEIYKEIVQYHYLGIRGYLEQVAKYLSLLVIKAKYLVKKAIKVKDQNGDEKKNMNEYFGLARELLELARKDYETHIKYFFRKHEDIEKEKACPYNNHPIEDYLRRLRSEHYDVFTKNMQKFYEEITKEEKDIKGNEADLEKISEEEFQDLVKGIYTDADSLIYLREMKQKFIGLLFDLEKNRDDLAWRKRKYQLEFNTEWLKEDSLNEWCNKCLPDNAKNESKSFLDLLQCPNTGEKGSTRLLNYKNYEKIMDNWDNHFLDHLENPSFHNPRNKALHFLGLQRWNSSSPAQGRSLGGGYLIYHTDNNGRVDMGIALDPGFDFLRNLFHAGFSLADIDVVLLSHAHLDHVRDFESMVTLCYELKKRKKHIKKLHTVMTLGVYRRLERVIENPGLREFIEPYVLDIKKEIDPKFVTPYIERIESKPEGNKHQTSFEFLQEKKEKKNSERTRFHFKAILTKKETNVRKGLYLKITPTRAYHNDYSEYSDSFGFKICIEDKDCLSAIPYSFGYTGDTSCYDDIIGQYEECETLLIHMGSLIDRNRNGDRYKSFQDYSEPRECFKLIAHKNHPYLMGMLHFLRVVHENYKKNKKNPLVLVSEFGEELRGRIRLDLIERLKNTFCKNNIKDNHNILPVDVGLDVILAEKVDNNTLNTSGNRSKYRVRCVQCQEFVFLDQADFETYGHDEALFCVCITCKKSTPHDVLQDRLRTLYEVGRELHTR